MYPPNYWLILFFVNSWWRSASPISRNSFLGVSTNALTHRFSLLFLVQTFNPFYVGLFCKSLVVSGWSSNSPLSFHYLLDTIANVLTH